MRISTLLNRLNEGLNAPDILYRGVKRSQDLTDPLGGTQRGVPTFTTSPYVAREYAGSDDLVYQYRADIRKPLKTSEDDADVTEANVILRKLGITDLDRAWKILMKYLYEPVKTWRSDGDTFFHQESFPRVIAGYAGFPDKSYQSLYEVFVDHWVQDYPGFYCHAHDLADSVNFQELARKAGFDCLFMMGYSTVSDYGDVDIGQNRFLNFPEWRPLYPDRQITPLGPVDFSKLAKPL